ncbi:AurF N-oxygenase family protein [Spirillospora sp. CA-294931]|uniref:AurF N-oxygenase family protein n=1 Tax=Spirillospora sp. CA-294931 TaxID=3240042 RepID=UPI003D92E003
MTSVSEREIEDITYEKALARLSKASVNKHWEPYKDIPWDDPEYAVDPEDPRWILPAHDPLSRDPWYLAQTPRVQARIGLYRQANVAKVGMQFENLLNRGLLAFALRLPNGSPEFRYVYHEMIEEGHHGLMFQEFVNRSGTEVEGMPRPLRWFGEAVQALSILTPTLYFFGVLAGEEPIDYMQRRILRDASSGHPLLNKIMAIHVAEEARHISFGREYIRHHVPRMPAPTRFALSLAVPPTAKVMAIVILTPPSSMARAFDIPKDVVKNAYWGSDESKDAIKEAVSGLRDLCADVGLMNPISRPVWKLLGLWKD